MSFSKPCGGVLVKLQQAGPGKMARMLFDDWFGVARVLIVGALSYAALVVLLRSSGKRTLSK